MLGMPSKIMEIPTKKGGEGEEWGEEGKGKGERRQLLFID